VGVTGEATGVGVAEDSEELDEDEDSDSEDEELELELELELDTLTSDAAAWLAKLCAEAATKCCTIIILHDAAYA